MKIILLLIPLILLSSCSEGTERSYYISLREECSTKNDYEKNFCNKSVDIMEKQGYKKAEEVDNRSICPQGMMVDGIKAIGAIFYCRPE